jgi:uncharacterized membrane protein YkvA (DUF1232 family)
MTKMPTSNTEPVISFFHDLVLQARLVWRLFRDQRVPLWVKAIPPLLLLYLLSPIDLIPDWLFPGLGELDDVAIILLGLKLFVEMAPQQIVASVRDELLQSEAGSETGEEEVIDTTYHIID